MIIVENVLSTVKNDTKDLNNAPFWKNCYRKEEVTEEMLKNGKQWYEYVVKFDGTKILQLNKTNILKKY